LQGTGGIAEGEGAPSLGMRNGSEGMESYRLHGGLF
jgi:hypothetical protein